eukprot:CAMPEP_0117678808 /NCGR_PEP_ID=MMETSP0804-20121206/17491_1 /TAXON_ID=1074897 /ORGANISM="Tetraselmis astigmatica, Strain CCMP880" /LENGTH=97 /DNA_ID=CAMNT_0005488213 /DNA_START=1028 /DNA_END=1319 /DNA_ORIENTATION=-
MRWPEDSTDELVGEEGRGGGLESWHGSSSTVRRSAELGVEELILQQLDKRLLSFVPVGCCELRGYGEAEAVADRLPGPLWAVRDQYAGQCLKHAYDV